MYIIAYYSGLEMFVEYRVEGFGWRDAGIEGVCGFFFVDVDGVVVCGRRRRSSQS